MDPGLRRAWTDIVTAGDYEEHMAAVGQATAAAELTAWLVASAALPAGSALTIAGAGTGQMFDLLDRAVFRPYRLTCADLNPVFLARLQQRLTACGLEAEVVEDDIECTRLRPAPDLLLAVLLLEHIDWRRGVEVFAALRPRFCGIVLQENPPQMTTAVTPGRRLPPSIACAIETGHPTLVPQDDLVAAMAARGYSGHAADARDIADGKLLVALLFRMSPPVH